MKNIKFIMIFFSLIFFSFITANHIKSPYKAKNDITLYDLVSLTNAQAESGGATCSIDCGDGTSVSLTCSYECRASSAAKAVRCFDSDGNIVEEKSCS